MTGVSDPDATSLDATGADVTVLLRAAERRLHESGVDSARYDAEALLDHLLGSRTARFTVLALAPSTAESYRQLVERRAAREPLQHILGTVGFRGLALAVGPGVFAPRPETELLVEWGLSVLPGPSVRCGRSGSEAHPGTLARVVVDLCAGSGSVGLAVAAERPHATVYAVEADPGALAWLRRNAATYPGVTVVAGDATDPTVLSTVDGTVDLVLANPPYVPDGRPVPPEVAHDPPAALWGGPDGLAVLRGVAARAVALLRPGGWFGVEHDESHPAEVRAVLAGLGLAGPTTRSDLAGRPRFSIAAKVAGS